MEETRLGGKPQLHPPTLTLLRCLPWVKHTKSQLASEPGQRVPCNTEQSTGRAGNGPESKQADDRQGLPACLWKEPRNAEPTSSPSHPKMLLQERVGGFPGGAVVRNLPANAGDTGLSPGLGRSHMPRSN